MSKQRIELERQIIGMALYGGFGRVASMLKPNNFTATEPYNHQYIWAAMGRLWPTDPVELLTVAMQLNKEKINYAHYIAHECDPLTVSGRNIEYYALVLLEMDIRQKLLQCLTNEQLKATSASNMDLLTILKQCIDLIKDSNHDLFQSNATIEGYLEAYAPATYTEYRKYSAAIPAKVAQVKEAAQVKTLFQHLYSLSREKSDVLRAQVLVRMESLMKQVLIDADLPHGIESIFNIQPKPEYEQ